MTDVTSESISPATDGRQPVLEARKIVKTFGRVVGLTG